MKKARRRLLTSSVLITASTAALDYMINKMISAFCRFEESSFFGESDFYEWRFGRVYYKKYGENGDPLIINT